MTNDKTTWTTDTTLGCWTKGCSSFFPRCHYCDRPSSTFLEDYNGIHGFRLCLKCEREGKLYHAGLMFFAFLSALIIIACCL